MPRKALLALGAVALIAAAATGAWALWFRTGVRAGAGPFTAELEQCHARVGDEVQRIEHQLFPDTVWREGDATELTLGGKFRVQGAVHNYSCRIRQGRVVMVEVW